MSKSLLLIFGVYLALAFAYNWASPAGEAPDEPAHFLYAQHMAESGAPPPQAEPQRASFWLNGYVTSNYEWHQPPLYYALNSLLLRLGRAAGLTERYAAFPAVSPDFPGLNRPLFVSVPFVFTEVHLARLLSTLLGLGTIWATFALARILLPGRAWLPELAAGFVAFSPQFTFLHAYVTNDSLAILTSNLTLLALVRVALAGQTESRRAWLLAGGAAALAVAAKMTTWYLLPLALILAALRQLTGQDKWGQTASSLLAFGALSIAGLLLSRLIWSDFFHRLLDSPQSQGINPDYFTLDHLRVIWPMAHTSFWGMFGWVNMPLPDHLLWTLDGVLLVGLAGAVVWLVRERARIAPGQASAFALLLIAVGAVLLAFWLFNLTILQPQGRFVYTAISAIAVGVALGWRQWAGRFTGVVALLLLAVMIAVNLLGLFTVVIPNFAVLAR